MTVFDDEQYAANFAGGPPLHVADPVVTAGGWLG